MQPPVERLKSIAESIARDAQYRIEEAYKLGVRDGQYQARQWLRAELEKYSKDSVVAQLLAEKFQEE